MDTLNPSQYREKKEELESGWKRVLGKEEKSEKEEKKAEAKASKKESDTK